MADQSSAKNLAKSSYFEREISSQLFFENTDNLRICLSERWWNVPSPHKNSLWILTKLCLWQFIEFGQPLETFEEQSLSYFKHSFLHAVQMEKIHFKLDTNIAQPSTSPSWPAYDYYQLIQINWQPNLPQDYIGYSAKLSGRTLAYLLLQQKPSEPGSGLTSLSFNGAWHSSDPACFETFSNFIVYFYVCNRPLGIPSMYKSGIF